MAWWLALPAQALDEQRLWLPAKHRALQPALIDAAKAAEAIERCVVVIEGTLDLDHSRPDHPIYRILCRQENGRTYNEMVDGLTFATLTTPAIVEPVLTAEEQELLRQQEERARLAELALRKKTAWELCRHQLLHRTRMMKELKWALPLENPLEPSEFTEETARFSVDFDARGMWNEPLRYTADCTTGAGVAEVKLRKR